jgi:hypothetical protein
MGKGFLPEQKLNILQIIGIRTRHFGQDENSPK